MCEREGGNEGGGEDGGGGREWKMRKKGMIDSLSSCIESCCTVTMEMVEKTLGRWGESMID